MENPFLLRELRQLFGQSRPLWVWSLGVLFGMLCSALLLNVVAPYQPPRWRWKTEWLYLLLPIHALLCFLAGVYGANRIFAEEHRRDTLDGLHLLPWRPGKLLAAKLALPLLLAFITWAVGLPVYTLAYVLGCARWEIAAQLSLVCLGVGLAVIPVVMLLPPDYRDRLHRLGTGAGGGDRDSGADMQIRTLLLVSIFLALMGFAVYRVSGRGGYSISFFGAMTPEWLVWVAGFLPLTLAGIASGMSVLCPEGGWPRRAALARLCALGAVYGVAVGLFWEFSAVLVRVVLILAFPAAMAFLHRGRKGASEDPLTDAEIAWVRRRWDNAVLIRDLRVYGRFSSLRRSFLIRGLGPAALMALFAWGITWVVVGEPQALPHPAGWGLALPIAAIMAIIPSVQASQSWLRERTAHTMAMLILTPLRPEEMMRGRLLAAAIHYGLTTAPVLLLGLFMLLAALWQGYWSAGAAMLAFSPLVLSLVLAIESAERPETSARPGAEAGAASMILILSQFGCILAGLGLGIIGPEIPWGQSGVWIASVLVCLFAAAGGIAAYQIRLQQLRSLTSADTD